MADQTNAKAGDNIGDVVVVERSAPQPDVGRNDPQPGAEQHDAQRRVVGMRGHYRLAGWRDSEGHEREFPCEILKMSPHVLKFSAPVVGTIGNWVVARFEHLGKIEGPIVQTAQRALVMKIFGTNEDRAKVADRLAWITDAEKPEGRRYPRIVPVHPDSTVVTSAGLAVPCEVIDYSMGGAAVYADAVPAIGAAVKLGSVSGHVVRHFGGGFAISFAALQDMQTLEAAILPPKSASGSP
jgi:hypothetical protein